MNHSRLRALAAVVTVISFTWVSNTSALIIGNQSTFSYLDWDNAYNLKAEKVTLSQAATVQSISIYCNGNPSKTQVGIYSDDNGSPGVLMAATYPFTPTTTGWSTKPTKTAVSLSQGTYWLVWEVNSNTTQIRVNYPGVGMAKIQKRTSWTDLPAFFGTSQDDWQANYPCYATLTTTAPNAPTFATIPRSLGLVIDDLGWQGGSKITAAMSCSGIEGPFRVGPSLRDPLLSDYERIVNAAKNVGTRIQGAFALSELDQNRICAQPQYNYSTAEPWMTSMTECSDIWTNSNYATPFAGPADPKNEKLNTFMEYVRANAGWLEFGAHAVRHEHWITGKLYRAEWAKPQPGYADTYWCANEIENWSNTYRHINCFTDLMRQYWTPLDCPYVESFVAAGHIFYYKTGSTRTTAAAFGVYLGTKYMNNDITRNTGEKSGLIDNGVLLLNRRSTISYEIQAQVPPNYAPMNYFWEESHLANWYGAQTSWENWLKGINNHQDRYLPKNTEQNCSQWLYRKYATIQSNNGTITINNTQMDGTDPYNRELLGTLVIKTPLFGKHISTATIDNNAQIVGYYEDSCGYGYLVIGHAWNRMGRLDKQIYTLRSTLGTSYLNSYVDLPVGSPTSPGATYNVYSLTSGLDYNNQPYTDVGIKMYGTQKVKVKLLSPPTLPYASAVSSYNTNLIVQNVSYSTTTKFLTMTVQGINIQGESGNITIKRQ